MGTLKSWNANQYIANLHPVVVKQEVDTDGVSLLVNTSKGKMAMGFWIDFWVDKYGELCYNWNQYIFHLTDEDDCMRREMQDNTYFWEAMINTALDYIEEHNLIPAWK